MDKIFLVAIGGAIGATLRFVSIGAATRLTGESFWGTITVNVVGSFAMGVAAVLIIERLPGDASRLGPLIMAGVLGGFTTFSAFSLDALRLIEEERLWMAGAYLLGSVILSVLALFLGIVMTRGAV